MSLGVLNNLSAIYAEHNLNNTNSSLQTVLQQLSSGSKINSGADDAAGLSLVNGLAANSAALTQSETNATEGVGLLEVADGALSQVTSMLNRAITLATEASNGTLNSTQEAAANNEYQSIMAEINNIGSTTTYNQQTVFTGNTIAIYTGDSSTTGSSVDNLNIRTLSSSSVGDTGGTMSYSSGADNVFMDLSNQGHNAAITDSLNTSGATTVNVSYMTKGAGGTATTATAAISVGAGTSYANTTEGLIGAINNAGLGLTATFGTATEAGLAAAATASDANNGGGSGSDTGIIVSATGIGAGTNGTGVVGALSMISGDTLGGTLTVVGSDGASHNIALGVANSTDSLSNLEATINSAGYGVTASLTQNGTQLTFTTGNPKVTMSASNLTESSASIPSTITVGGSVLGSLSVGSASDTLTGNLNIQEGLDGKNTTSTLALGGQTLAQLQTTLVLGGYGIQASLSGTTLTFTKAAGDLGTAAISGTSITDVAAPTVAPGGTLGSLTVASAGDTLGAGTLTIKSGTGVTSSLTLGSALKGTDTVSNLANTITNGGYGITASLDSTGTVLTFTQTSGTSAAGIAGTGIDNTYAVTATSIVAGKTLGSITLNGANDTMLDGTPGQGLVLSGNATGTLGTITVVNSTSSAAADAETLTGTLNLTDSTGVARTINLATAGVGATPLTLSTLATYLNTGAGVAWGITATYNASAPGTLNTANIVFSTVAPLAKVVASPGLTGVGAGNVSVTASTVATTTLDLGTAPLTLTQLRNAVNADTAAYGITAALSTNGKTLTFTQTSGAATSVVSETGTSTDTTPAAPASTSVVVTSGNTLGSLSVTSSSELLTGTIDYTPAVHGGVATSYNLNAAGETLAQIEGDFNNFAGTVGSANNIVATLSPDGKSLVFTESSSAPANAATPSVSTPVALTEHVAVTPGSTLGALSANNANDTLSGSFTVQEGVDGKNTPTTLVFTSQTLAQIEQTINTGGYGITATPNPAGNGLVAGTVLTFTQTAGDSGTAGITNDGVITDTAPAVTNAPVNVSNPNAGVNLGTLSAITSGDILDGTLNIVSATGVTSTFTITGQTLSEIVASFNQPPDGQNDNTGITASLNLAGTTITFTTTAGGAPTIGGLGITDLTPPSTVNQEVDTGTILNTLTVANASDKLIGSFNVTEGVDKNGTVATLAFGGQTIAQIEADFNTSSGTDLWNTYGITASVTNNTLTFSQTLGDAGIANVTKSGFVTDQIQASTVPQTLTGPTMLNTLTAVGAADPLNGTLTIQEGADGKNTASTYNLAGQTVAEIVAAFTTGAEANLGITATATSATVITFSQTPGDLGTAKIGNSTNIQDGNAPPTQTPITVASGTLMDSLSVNNGADLLGGTLNLTSSITGTTSALPLGTSSSTDTLANLAKTINAGGFGITAALNPAGTKLTFTQTSGGFNAAVSGTALTDSEGTSIVPSTNLGSLTVSTASDVLSGTLTGMQGDGLTAYTINLGAAGSTDTLQDLEHTINVTDAGYGITATLNPSGTSLSFTSSAGDTGTPTLGNEGSITDTTPAVQTAIGLTETPATGTTASTTLGSLAILNTDRLSGSLGIGQSTISIDSTDNSAATLTAAINKGNYGVTAAYNSATNTMTFMSPNSALTVNTSNLEETVLNGSSPVGVGALTGGVSTASPYYSIGISGTITDSSTAVTVGNTTTYGGTTNVGITSDSNGGGGTATIGYTDGAGQSLSGTDLLTQKHAQDALNELNVAITDVSAQDGYIGAQINTLNSVSQVMTTQQENVVSAQNAIQATDYASATSNMSKYEILSQTGISALAQANSQQREVTKLLQ